MYLWEEQMRVRISEERERFGLRFKGLWVLGASPIEFPQEFYTSHFSLTLTIDGPFGPSAGPCALHPLSGGKKNFLDLYLAGPGTTRGAIHSFFFLCPLYFISCFWYFDLSMGQDHFSFTGFTHIPLVHAPFPLSFILILYFLNFLIV